eukprot:4495321-Pyramimonas_sp.AAC.1
MCMNTAPRSARPAAFYEHLRNAYSRNQRGFMYRYVLLSLLTGGRPPPPRERPPSSCAATGPRRPHSAERHR